MARITLGIRSARKQVVATILGKRYISIGGACLDAYTPKSGYLVVHAARSTNWVAEQGTNFVLDLVVLPYLAGYPLRQIWGKNTCLSSLVLNTNFSSTNRNAYFTYLTW